MEELSQKELVETSNKIAIMVDMCKGYTLMRKRLEYACDKHARILTALEDLEDKLRKSNVTGTPELLKELREANI